MDKIYILTVEINPDNHFSFDFESPFAEIGFRGWSIKCGWTQESAARTQAVNILNNLRASVKPSSLGEIEAKQVKKFLRKASQDIKSKGITDRYESCSWDGSIVFGCIPILQ